MKTTTFLLALFVSLTLSSCNKRKCYECKLERTDGSISRINKCFDKDDRRSYVKQNIDAYENVGYKCRAKLFDR